MLPGSAPRRRGLAERTSSATVTGLVTDSVGGHFRVVFAGLTAAFFPTCTCCCVLRSWRSSPLPRAPPPLHRSVLISFPSGHRVRPLCSKQSVLLCAVGLVRYPKSFGQETTLSCCNPPLPRQDAASGLLHLATHRFKLKLDYKEKTPLTSLPFFPGYCWTASPQGLHGGGNVSHF